MSQGAAVTIFRSPKITILATKQIAVVKIIEKYITFVRMHKSTDIDNLDDIFPASRQPFRL